MSKNKVRMRKQEFSRFLQGNERRCTWLPKFEVYDPRDALAALMLVLAIDAEKCARKD